MNPIAAGVGVLALIASFFSLTDGVKIEIKPADLSAEARADWAALRNNRPCFGANDPACPYPLPNEK